MRLTRFTDNALRCLMLLGLEPERCITVNEIAERMNMSYEHLVKIVHRLSEFGYVETVRGRHGGVRLGKSVHDISIGVLVRQTEENLALAECFDPQQNTCPISSACRLTGTFDEALNAFLAVLDQKTLADILEPRAELVPLLVRRESMVVATSYP
ncbi:RrF2 family transcriptional regulator [Gemmatimonas groenlandica]|uniref:Rrf2 family transcriptional regulator n=1 Tax=Gemmatimonas groenlandica TaxID=2732249 RepID=A0A6M4INL5_9BACT|nr:Rrf2 family transcriptional regulator [Gemmatimonas groenlandica]QJR35339.1 Rrf2 family transcriptional regulator [Gemmatimonas groenlandica]